MRAMCDIKLVDKKMKKDIMQMFDLEGKIDLLAKANSFYWYGYVLRKDKNYLLSME